MTTTEVMLEEKQNEEGYITPDALEGMDIEDIQNMIEYLEEVVELCVGREIANLKVLKEFRSKLGLLLFETAYKGQTSFEKEKHIYIKQPKSSVSGKLFKDTHETLWKDLTMNCPELLNASKDDMDKFLRGKGYTKEQREKILKEICAPMKPAVVAKKRTI